MRILQINLNRSRTANSLREQIAQEKEADLMIISEQYTYENQKTNWFTDPSDTAAIWVVNKSLFSIEAKGAGPGYVWIRSNGVTYFSCYLTPNEPIGDFEVRLAHIEDEVRNTRGELLIAGDFNSKAIEWGEPTPDSRGRRVMEMAARLGVIIINRGDVPTFRRAGYTNTIPDITLASERLARQISGWQVLEDYSASDHQYILYQIGENETRPMPIQPPLWNVQRIDKEIFDALIQLGKGISRRIRQRQPEGPIAKLLVAETMSLLTRACESSMPKKSTRRNRYPAYWWNNEIADMRKNCLRLRRLAQRARRNTVDFQLKTEQYRVARHALKFSIIKSKTQKWKELCEDVNNDPWGLGYKIVLQKLKGTDSSLEMPTDVKERIVEELFPTHDIEHHTPVEVTYNQIPLFTIDELNSASEGMRNKKAPGPDKIPAEILKIVVQNHPEVLLEMYNACLTEGIFPKQWKVAKLVLIGKGKGDPNTASAHRPLCMLDTAGKLFEKLLKRRTLGAVAEAGGLSPRQYGFISGRSTIDAVNEVVMAAKTVRTGNHWSRDLCMAVTLDVKNAFNSVKWRDILQTLRVKFQLPQYLYRVLQDYLSERWVIFDTRDGPQKKQITSGAAQGSILGPNLWNINYDDILNLDMPEGVFLVGYADDIVAVITARSIEYLQMKLNQTMRRITAWMESKSLSLAVQKTEIVLLTTKHIERIVEMHVGEQQIQTKEAVKYLGIMLDGKLSFWNHICKAADKAAKVVSNLSRLMANIGGPTSNKRRLLIKTADAIMLYGAEIWAESLRFQKYRQRMEAVQRRGALRICSAFRTVSAPAAQVIAGVIPIDILADERLRIYRRKDENASTRVKKEERERTMNIWQRRWEREMRGRWTAKLISNIERWTKREYGEINYYVTQFLTGHGYFRSFLKKIGKTENAQCVYCQIEDEDVNHTFFICPKWQPLRHDISTQLGEFNTETIIAKMIETRENWDAMSTYIITILKEKELNRSWE